MKRAIRDSFRQSGLLILIYLAACTTGSSLNRPEAKVVEAKELHIPRLGVKVVPFSDSQKFPRVTAVLENGPAFFAYIQPGDIIIRFAGKYVNSSEELANLVRQDYELNHIQVRVSYPLQGGGHVRERSTYVSLWQPDPGGSWITSEMSHSSAMAGVVGRQQLPTFAKARAEALAQYNLLREEALENVRTSSPCEVRYEDLEEIERSLSIWAFKAGSHGEQVGLLYELDRTAEIACSNLKAGGLPTLEALLFSMTLGGDDNLNPCTYNPSTDYSDRINYQRTISSAEDYNAFGFRRFELFTERKPAEKECFLDFIETVLTGSEQF